MKLGEKGEELAVKYLKKKGYKIIIQNYKNIIGEIDIIASDKNKLVFIEVKTRESIEYGQPFEAVNKTKKRKIANTALLYLKRYKELPSCRFDVVSINYEKDKHKINLIKDAFSL